MEYNSDGTMKQAARVYPLQLYKKSGEIVVANNDQERNAAIAAGASLKIWDRETHVEPVAQATAPVAVQESAAVEPEPEPERKSRRSAR